MAAVSRFACCSCSCSPRQHCRQRRGRLPVHASLSARPGLAPGCQHLAWSDPQRKPERIQDRPSPGHSPGVVEVLSTRKPWNDGKTWVIVAIHPILRRVRSTDKIILDVGNPATWNRRSCDPAIRTNDDLDSGISVDGDCLRPGSMQFDHKLDPASGRQDRNQSGRSPIDACGSASHINDSSDRHGRTRQQPAYSYCATGSRPSNSNHG